MDSLVHKRSQVSPFLKKSPDLPPVAPGYQVTKKEIDLGAKLNG
jgi:hypothetical protein